MGILGNTKVKRRNRSVPVGFDEQGKEVRLTVYPPGLDATDRLNALIPEPVAPLAKNSAGQSVKIKDDSGKTLIDQTTGSALLARDYKSATYQRAIEQRDKALTVALILECLGDAAKPAKDIEDYDGDWLAYYLGAWKELEEAGLDIGSYRALSAACTSLSLPLGAEDVELAKQTLALDEVSQAEIKEEALKEGVGKLEGKSE